MGFLECVLYGLISGITEILPVSSQAHQRLMLILFGADQRDPLMDLMIHFAVLLAVFFVCYSTIARLRREEKTKTLRRRRTAFNSNAAAVFESRLLKSAALPLCVGLFTYLFFSKWENSLLWLVFTWALNGVVLYVSGHMRQGNKEARSMSGFDGVLIGIAGVLSAIPGLSRMGIMIAVSVLRGADKRHALNWALLLTIPAITVFMLIDIIGIASVGIGAISVSFIAGCIGAAIAAFAGSYMSILLIQFLIVRFDLSGFSYYCWGIAMLSFILYLMI